MNFPFFIAKRYFFSKQTTNVINVISLISLIGVAFGTMAFVVVLSIFNGIENMASSLLSSFDPDLRIELNEGKSFKTDSIIFEKLKHDKDVAYMSFVIEENALLEYDKKQLIATIKAVDNNYEKVSGLDTMIYSGQFVLSENPQQYAVVGYGVAAKLGITTSMVYPLKFWVSPRSKGINMNIQNAFDAGHLPVSGIFSVQQEYDETYVIVPLDFAQELLNYENRATTLELKLHKCNQGDAQKRIQTIVGDKFSVKNRVQQKELIYKIMKSERLAVIAILSFILLVSSFNIVGSMIMLIIDKKSDIDTLNYMGTDLKNIRKIFIIEGWLISFIGAVIGLALGLLIAYVQQFFGLIKFATSGTFSTTAYPVEVHLTDTFIVFSIVLLIGFLVANFPVKYISKKFIASK